jgi:hypothetical protein
MGLNTNRADISQMYLRLIMGATITMLQTLQLLTGAVNFLNNPIDIDL